MNRTRHFLPVILASLLLGAAVSIYAADETEKQYRAVVANYQRDEARLPKLIHYQKVTGGGANGESLRREAWVSVDAILTKTAEERRGPKGGELLETSLNYWGVYFLFHRKSTLLPNGSWNVEESRKYWHQGSLVRWTKRSATFAEGQDIDWKGVKQQQIPVANVAPDDFRTDLPNEAADSILAALKAEGKPQYDPTESAGSDWQKIKLVKETGSPSGRYQLTWAPAKKDFDWKEYSDDNGNFWSDGEGEVTNFIFDLTQMKIVGKTLGAHFGTKPRYNHREVTMAWSPDDTTFVQVDSAKWEFTGCCVGKIADGKLVGCVDLGGPVVKEAGKFLVAKRNRAWKKNSERMAMSIFGVTVANDGTVTLDVVGQVPKGEEPDSDVELRVKMKVTASADGVKVTPIGAEFPKK